MLIIVDLLYVNLANIPDSFILFTGQLLLKYPVNMWIFRLRNHKVIENAPRWCEGMLEIGRGLIQVVVSRLLIYLIQINVLSDPKGV